MATARTVLRRTVAFPVCLLLCLPILVLAALWGAGAGISAFALWLGANRPWSEWLMGTSEDLERWSNRC